MISRRLLLTGLTTLPAGDALAQIARPGFSSGFRAGFQFLGAVYPVTATPLMLPSAAGTPTALYSVACPSNYVGPCLRLVRVSDSAQKDFGFNAAGYVDSAAALTWANGSALKITTFYDLSGGGNHATQTTLANMPDFAAENALNGNWPITFNSSTAGSGSSQFLNLPATIVLDRANMSVFVGANPSVSLQANGYLQFNNGGTTQFDMYTFGSYRGLCCDRPGASVASGLAPRAQPNAFGVVSSSTAHNFYVQGKTSSAGNALSATMNTGGYIGKNNYGGAHNLRSDIFSIAVYNTALSDTNAKAVISALNVAHGFPTVFSARIILDGDSILEGILLMGSSGTTGSLQNWVRQMTGLKGTPEIFNMGIAGQTLAGCVSSFTNKIDLLINGTTLPIIVGFEAGINDLNSATSSTAVKAAAGDYIKAVRATKAGIKVLGQTLLPRGPTSPQTYRDEYNAYIRAGTLTATDGTTVNTLDGIVDVAGDPTMGPPASTTDTTLYADQLHPVKRGDSFIAPIWSAALNAQLP